MQVLRHPNGFELVLFQPESIFLRQSLEQIIQNYRSSPGDLPEEIRSKWFPDSPDLDPDDREILNEERIVFRGENAALAEKLLQKTADNDQWPLVIGLKWEDADRLLTLVNDQRLYLAAIHQVSEADMTDNLENMKASPKKSALMQIHFLAWLVELIVLRMSEGGACG